MKLKLFLTVLSLLVGCAGTPVADSDFTPTPVTFNVQVAYSCGQPPPVSMVIMRDINWEIIEVDGLQFSQGSNMFTGNLFTLTVDDYKFLGLNVSDWIAASAEMKEQRDFYRDCIVRSQKEINDGNLDADLATDIPAD